LRIGNPLTALFLDIDHFKQFNDTYSYAVGDHVLQRLAGVIRENIRKVDVAGRYGGEEFVVLLPETEQQAAMEVAERLRVAVMDTRVSTDQEEAGFTVSIGICQKTPDLPDLDALVACAGQALHQAKEEGRNRVICAYAGQQYTFERSVSIP
jgi:diguanylate cyclase (GGDEF)-like protein